MKSILALILTTSTLLTAVSAQAVETIITYNNRRGTYQVDSGVGDQTYTAKCSDVNLKSILHLECYGSLVVTEPKDLVPLQQKLDEQNSRMTKLETTIFSELGKIQKSTLEDPALRELIREIIREELKK